MIPLIEGDVFCVSGNMPVLSSFIRLAEKFWSEDNEAEYGHSGIIVSRTGFTFEALWTIRESNLAAYIGQKVIIARPMRSLRNTDITLLNNKRKAISALSTQYLGRIYPFWRLFFHAFPPAAKYISIGNNMVCSELVARYLAMIGARHNVWQGTNPDELADEWRTERNYRIIYEGELKNEHLTD